MKTYITRIKKILNQFNQVHDYLTNDLKSPKILMGQIMADRNKEKDCIDRLSEVEFQVFSQWGDDGILQYLTNKINIPHKTFVEFGVENYRESNTRFLLINNKWHGLVLDGSKDNIDYIKKDPIFWASHLYAKQIFITKANINETIKEQFLEKGYNSQIGVLSVDIDGNDYWIWEAINCITPVIVVVEYNALFGTEKKWTIPYIENFVRYEYDSSDQYWGASLAGLCCLAESKGYHFVGCNSNGNNAYFIKSEFNTLKKISVEDGYEKAFFRLYRDEKGEFLKGKEALKPLLGKEIYDIEQKKVIRIIDEKIQPGFY
jgi:hypothetical protein